jgi:hypothetical protein
MGGERKAKAAKGGPSFPLKGWGPDACYSQKLWGLKG